MHAVLRVDLQAVAVVVVLHKLVHTGRAVTAFGACEFGEVDADGHRCIFERQVCGLVFFVVGVADEHAAQAVKRELTVGLGVGNLGVLGRWLQVHMVGLGGMQRPRWVVDAEFGQQPVFDAGHQHAHELAFFEPQFEVAVLVEFFAEPALVKRSGVGAQLIVSAAC